MSESDLKLDESEIHYVYEDQEYILDQDDINPELRDLLCSNKSRAILVDGQYIVTDNQTILLQEGDTSLTQYYINDTNEGFVVDGEDACVNNLFQNSECVQLVEEDTNSVQQIIYYTNDEPDAEEFTPVHELAEADVAGIQDEDGNIYPFKRIKLEGQMLNFDEFVEKQENLVDQQTNEQSLEYTIMEDENTYQTESCNSEDVTTESSDGQTVTLHSYMEKLKRRLKTSHSTNLRNRSPKKVYNDELRKPELSDLLDKKISIGKTRSGKKIIGKIIHVERKTDLKRNQQEEEKNVVVNDRLPQCDDVEDTYVHEKNQVEENEEEVPIEAVKIEDPARILVKKCSVSKESFEQISKTLGGIMEMESVRKKLENKNIVVKLVERRYSSENDTFIKTTSYSYGYMERDVGQIVDDEVVEKWKFVLDQDTQDVLLGDHFSIDSGNDKLERKSTKFTITTSLTILISYGKGGNKTIRVNLNPAPGNLCIICAQYFKTNLQLRQHMNAVHNTYGNNTICEVCDKSCDDLQKLQEHRNIHVEEGKLFLCSECNKCFTSQNKLQKHLPSHDVYLRPLECSVCEVRCASEWALKRHLLTHTGIKPFSCDICSKQFLTQYDVNFHKKIHFPDKHFACNVCMRTFSRHSNLLRHTEIHKGTGALYKCDICYCSYNYISSLTRHMVQNHIDAGDFRKEDEKE
ncbi:GDNF-inducible zinc finger protein 1-like isoform X2 [Tenebrio molitor]|uniref:GDNF-inducible zinc finger protein 1-like isoform X2 n=1 Tax=Tenebrio molitor TaxID=7067 RepID=UPI0036248AE7